MSDLAVQSRVRAVKGEINYNGPMAERPRYYANDHSRDRLNLEPHTVTIEDARSWTTPPDLDREGFVLIPHKSAVADFRNREEVARTHPAEIERLLLEVTGADKVVVSGSGILRFGESAPEAGKLDNSYPARFIHIDCSDPTAVANADRAAPWPYRRFCHYNVWRVLSPPPQDIPLAICDARSLAPEDLLLADAVFDPPPGSGAPEWSFEGLLVQFSPRHRWVYFSNMTRDEAIIFKTNDSDLSRAHHVPHSAFDDPSCPKGVPTRVSIEMRACAYWLA